MPLEFAALERSSIGGRLCPELAPTDHATNTRRVNDAECKSQRKRAVRRGAAPLQALLRESGRAVRGAPSRVLREAHLRAQAQGCRGGQTPRQEAAARGAPVREELLIP